MKPSTRLWYRFGPYRLCRSEGVLLRGSAPLSVSPRTFGTLAFLVHNSPNLVTVDELISAVWSGALVEPNNVTQHVFSVRKALGDNSQNPTYIQNVPRRGYRFIAPVERVEECYTEAPPQPEPVVPFVPPPSLPPGPKPRRLWIPLSLAGALLVSVLTAALAPVPQPSLHITGYRQLSHDGVQKDGPLLTDGHQVIYRSTEGTARMWALPLAGGEAVPLGNPGEVESDLSQDGHLLLLTSLDSDGATLWSRSIKGGPANMLADADIGSWSPDGKRLAAAGANMLSIFEGTKVIAKLSVNGQAGSPRWSPDGKTIRFSVERLDDSTLWEVRSDGSDLHPIMGFGASSRVLNGVWNRQGDLFFFTAHTEGSDNIWVSKERHLGFTTQDSKPVALTNGPGDWRWPLVSPDSKSVYAIHSVAEPQLTFLDAATKEWRPFWHDGPFYQLDFSHDGKWVACIRYYDQTLWKAKVDGSERVQLTPAGMEACQPHWSPDGKRISFMSHRPGIGYRATVIPSNGGPAEDVAPTGRGQGVPTWSPDGRALLFGDRTELKPGPHMNVHYVDLATHKVTDLPNSYGLWSPRWSPDGKYIAAPSFDGINLQVLKWPGTEWKNVLRLRSIQNVMWSADSKYIYFEGRQLVDCSEIYRLRIADNKLEMVVDLKNFRWAPENWFGITPQGTLLALYESSPQEVFAINYELR